MTRGIGAVGREFGLLLGVAGVFLVEGEWALTVVVILGLACAEVAGIFAHTYHQFENLGGLLVDFHTESL